MTILNAFGCDASVSTKFEKEIADVMMAYERKTCRRPKNDGKILRRAIAQTLHEIGPSKTRDILAKIQSGQNLNVKGEISQQRISNMLAQMRLEGTVTSAVLSRNIYLWRFVGDLENFLENIDK